MADKKISEMRHQLVLLGSELVPLVDMTVPIAQRNCYATMDEVRARNAPLDATYLTTADETARLTSSRRLVAGSNMAFDDSTPGQRTLNASGGGGGGLSIVTREIVPVTVDTDALTEVFSYDVAGGQFLVGDLLRLTTMCRTVQGSGSGDQQYKFSLSPGNNSIGTVPFTNPSDHGGGAAFSIVAHVNIFFGIDASAISGYLSMASTGSSIAQIGAVAFGEASFVLIDPSIDWTLALEIQKSAAGYDDLVVYGTYVERMTAP